MFSATLTSALIGQSYFFILSYGRIASRNQRPRNYRNRFFFATGTGNFMSDEYPIPASAIQQEQEIRRSRFITTLDHAPDPATARTFIARMQARYVDASHNCWAFVAGAPGSTAQVGCSDDGEPAGTAGQPMLKVLLHSGIGEIVGVTTRYFGGVKLGRGGLVRAYTGGVQGALEQLATVQKIEQTRVRLTLDYALLVPCQNQLARFDAHTETIAYSDRVQLHLVLPSRRYPEFAQWFHDLTKGQGQIAILHVD